MNTTLLITGAIAFASAAVSLADVSARAPQQEILTAKPNPRGRVNRPGSFMAAAPQGAGAVNRAG